MKYLYIIKAGTSFSSIIKVHGDFDLWIKNLLESSKYQIKIIDAENGDELPGIESCAGIVISGSHSMVTENLPWSVKLEKWILPALKKSVPVLGICYGHQLLAKATGGVVSYNPEGEETGSAVIHLTDEGKRDPLFKNLPDSFYANESHLQSVLNLPEKSVRLAFNDFDPNQAFRIGQCAWGVQFHPEFSKEIMQMYIEEEASELNKAGINPCEIIRALVPTQYSEIVLNNFALIVSAL